MKNPKKAKTFSEELLQFTSLEQRKYGVVCAVGYPNMTNLVKGDLEERGIQVKTFKTVASLKREFSGNEDAIIYCSPLVRSHIRSVHKNIKNLTQFQGVPFFAILQNWSDPITIREIYKMGIRMVFKWPRERFSFSELFSQALKTDTIAVHSEDTDRALKKAIVNRMIAGNSSLNPKIEFHVYHGIVILGGVVNSIGEKIELSGFIKKIPGVRGVIDSSMEIRKEALPGFLKARANEMLNDIDGVQDKTLMVKALPGQQKLKLMGSATSLKSVEQTKQKLEMFDGVKVVEADVLVSPRQHARDLALAKKAQSVANKATIASPHTVSIKVLQGDAIILGEVSSGIVKEQIETNVRDLDGIRNVKNQLKIDPGNRYASAF